MKFEVRFTNERLITPTGLAIAGYLLKQTRLGKRLNDLRIKKNEAPIISHSDIINSYIGILCQGKAEFEDIRELAVDEFFNYALNIKRMPSTEILRQRMDAIGTKARHIILDENAELLKKAGAHFTPCHDDFVPLDVDVSPFDNSNSRKEGVTRTYKGFDGYAPIFAYLGEEGYLINEQLRIGKDHCQNNTPQFLKETIKLAKRVTEKPILVRMDGGNDSAENIELAYDDETACDFLIKRNMRRETIEFWRIIVGENRENKTTNPRLGKVVHTGSVYWKPKNVDKKVRIVYCIEERTISASGQMLLTPEYEVQTWWTSLECDEEKVIELYKNHGTSEQFHSEIKSDMGVERLPSGKFDTNALVLDLTMIAYNILRIMGQESLKNGDIPDRKTVKRKRLKTVIQNLVYMASHIVTHARKIYMNLGCSNLWRFTFKRLCDAFA